MASVFSILASSDRWLARTRPLWGWAAELALVVLGVHLAADRLDDYVLHVLEGLQAPWPDPHTPFWLSTWVGVGLELLAALWALHTLSRTLGLEPVDRESWKEHATLHALTAPLAFAATSLAGSWVVAMALEDATATLGFDLPIWGAAAFAALVWARFGWPPIRHISTHIPRNKARMHGIVALPIVLLVTLLAIRHGLPIWGWL